MDYQTPAQTIASNAKNWRTSAATLRQEANAKLQQADLMERRAEEWEAAVAKLEAS